MAPTSLPLRIMETSQVAPPPDTTPNSVSLPFTFFDVIWIILPPVDRLFFYPYGHPTTHFLSSHLPSLKRSLSLALATYYPLAGGYRRKPGTEDKLEHYYKEGDGVSFTVAECIDGRFEDLASDHERDASQLDCLVPVLPKSGDDEELKPVFAVQVTVFPQQGIVIGTSMHHTVCDGSTSMQFMHTWAETCLSGVLSSSRVPVFDRLLVSDPDNLYSFFYNELKSAPQLASKRPSDLTVATFTFGQLHIQRMKQLVSTKAEQRKIGSFHCSTIVVTFAYVWTCFVRAKGIDNSKRVCMEIPADVRARIQPPLPAEYFGNCITFCLASANVADLTQDDGIVMAAEAIGKTIAKSSEKLKSACRWMQLMQEYGSFARVAPILTVAGSPKFRAYDIDFGFGRPAKVEILSATGAGSMSVAESRDVQGGIEIGIGFPKDEMDCFKKCFSDGLKLLSE